MTASSSNSAARSQAVDCAVDWQKRSAPADGDPDKAALRFRIGIHPGDVIAEGEDLYGEGVNIAARLEPLAEPGGIVLSEDAYRHVRGKVVASLRDLGQRELKNIAEPIRVFSAEIGMETGNQLRQRPKVSPWGQARPP